MARTLPPIRLLDIPIANLSPSELLEQLEAWIAGTTPRRVYVLRSSVLVEAQRRPRLKQVLLEADLNLCGGEELRVAARLTGQPVPDRLDPDDWIDLLIDRLAATGRGLAYLGGPPGAAQAWIDDLKGRHPGLSALARDGSFEKWGPENDRVMAAVVHNRPAVVLVGFGSPYQEEYAHAHADLLRAPLIIAVGPLAESRTGRWPRGPVTSGRLAKVGELLNGPVRQAARHLADPEFFARVLKARR